MRLRSINSTAVAPPATLGGRAQASAKVSWVDQDGPHEITTMEPTRLVTELAARFGGEIPELVVSRPSLEDVYLRMIGAEA